MPAPSLTDTVDGTYTVTDKTDIDTIITNTDLGTFLVTPNYEDILGKVKELNSGVTDQLINELLVSGITEDGATISVQEASSL
jgi:hypothetical protein